MAICTNPLSLFASLGTPPTDIPGLHFSAHSLPNRQTDFIARDVHDQPALLIKVQNQLDCIPPPPISLEHLLVDHGLECRIHKPDGSVTEGIFSVIRCIKADKLLIEYFLRAIVPVICGLPANPTYADVSRVVTSLAELFRKMSLANKKSIQGIWAELLIILTAHNPGILIEAWHTAPEDRYDFSLGTERIEVKSTMGITRSHRFSFEQLHPPDGIVVLVTSIFMEEANDGLSIFDLIDRIRAKINHDPHLSWKVDQIVSSALGSAWRQGMALKFNYERAISSVRFYESTTIPSIPGPVPSGVSLVRFQSDLTFAVPILLKTMAPRHELFNAIYHEG